MKRAREAAAQPGTRPEDNKKRRQRVAALDVGTHAAKLLVVDASWDAAGLELDPLARAGIVTRLGEGGGRERGGPIPPITDAGVARAEQAIAELADRARAFGVQDWVAAGTGVLRQAPNGRSVAHQLETVLGAELPILAPKAEAALSTLGARAGTGLGAPLVCVDLGGGSTELTAIGERGPRGGAPALELHSINLGCLTLAERHLGQSPGRLDLLRLARSLEGSVAPFLAPPTPGGSAPHWVAVGGTATALATMDLELAAHDPDRVHGHRLTRDAIARLADRLVGTGGRPSRSAAFHRQPVQVLLAGALLLGHLLEIHAVPALVVSTWGLRHGLLLARVLAGKGGREWNPWNPRLDPRRSTAAARRLAGDPLPAVRSSKR